MKLLIRTSDHDVGETSLGGDLASAGLANLYYPRSNRGPGLVFSNFAIGTAERIAASLAQEFLFSKFTRR